MNKKMQATLANPNTPLCTKLRLIEEDRHTRRIDEIKRAEKKLILLTPVLKELEALNVSIPLAHMEFTGTGIYLSCAGITEWEMRTYKALISIGFKDISTYQGTVYTTADLKRGRLIVSLFLPADYKQKAGGENAAMPSILSHQAGVK